jgi:hypothetical protein
MRHSPRKISIQFDEIKILHCSMGVCNLNCNFVFDSKPKSNEVLSCINDDRAFMFKFNIIYTATMYPQ